LKTDLVNFREKYADLFSIKQPEQKLYFIGGVVRDIFLGREHKDIDILCDCDTRGIAKQLAARENGAFFVLDEERNTSRVVVTDGLYRQVYDFARLQGENIEQDLALRDFTINAMAVDFDEPDRIIDPLHGKRDLSEGVLRCCSPASFSRDPIRVVRAIRYSISCQVKLETETLCLLKQSISGLKTISNERKRDEFFKLLETEKPGLGLDLMERLGILKEFGISQTTNGPSIFEKVTTLNKILSLTERKPSVDSNGDFFETSFNLRLGRYYPKLSEYFCTRNLSDRSEKQIILLVMLLLHLDDLTKETVKRSLLLSRDENAKIELLLTENQHVSDLVHKEEVSDRDLYRFFKVVEEGSLDLTFIYLANLWAQEASALNQNTWLHALERCESILTCFYERKEVIHPVPFLNGKDLMMQFDLAPGPLIGTLLDRLREEQAAGVIHTREQAIDWVEEEKAHLDFINR